MSDKPKPCGDCDECLVGLRCREIPDDHDQLRDEIDDIVGAVMQGAPVDDIVERIDSLMESIVEVELCRKP